MAELATGIVIAPKPWYTSKTVQVNTGLIALFILTQLPFMPGVPAAWFPWLAMAVGVVNLLLRLRTGTPIAGTPAAATTINIQSGGIVTGDGTAVTGPVIGGDVGRLTDG